MVNETDEGLAFTFDTLSRVRIEFFKRFVIVKRDKNVICLPNVKKSDHVLY